MSKRRVVVTGLGIVSPVGNTLAAAWDSICNGRSGIGGITHFDATAYTSRIAGEVRGHRVAVDDLVVHRTSVPRQVPACVYAGDQPEGSQSTSELHASTRLWSVPSPPSTCRTYASRSWASTAASQTHGASPVDAGRSASGSPLGPLNTARRLKRARSAVDNRS